MSKIENSFATFLDSKGIAYKREFKLGDYRYDFKVNNILIEIDPSYTHNSTKNSAQYTFRNKKKKKNVKGINGIEQSYHRKKTIYAINNGYKCIHKFDWIDNEYVLSLILNDFEMIDKNDTLVFYNKELNKIIKLEEYNTLNEDEKNKYVIFFTDGFEIVKKRK